MLGLMILAIALLVSLHIITVGLLNMGCVDEDLWEEVGDEVPAAWDEILGSSKSRGKPVPPGDYFTVIKGCHPVSSLSSYPRLLFGIARMLTLGHTLQEICISLPRWKWYKRQHTFGCCLSKTHTYFNATATETGFIVPPALCCYGKIYVMILIVPQDLSLLFADARGTHTLRNNLWPSH